jgi:hypothetical protein
MSYYQYAKLGLRDAFKRLMTRNRMESNVWEYERTGFISPFSPRFYTKQTIALRRYDIDTKQPLDKWDVILKDSLWNKAKVVKFFVSEDEAQSQIVEFNQHVQQDLDEKARRRVGLEQFKRDKKARFDL